MYISTIKEIEYNLQIMETTLAKGNGKGIDLGFLSIFAADIAALQASKKTKAALTVKLTEKLDVLANRVCEAHFKVAPLLPKKSEGALEAIPISTFLETYDPPSVGSRNEDDKEIDPVAILRGFHALNKGYKIAPVIGDGHCLFRAIGTRFIHFWTTLPKNQQIEYGDALMKRVEELAHGELFNKFIIVMQLMRRLASGSLKVKDVISNKERSDLIVAFLRQLACDYNQKEVKDFKKKIEGFCEKSVEDYVCAMCDMNKAKWGGPFESSALAKALGLNICVLDVERIGKYGMKSATHYKGRESGDDISLIFNNNHYDLAVRNV